MRFFNVGVTVLLLFLILTTEKGKVDGWRTGDVYLYMFHREVLKVVIRKSFLSVLVSAQHADGRHLVVVVVALTDVSGEFGADVVVLTDEALANGGGNLQQKHTLILAEENINNSLF